MNTLTLKNVGPAMIRMVTKAITIIRDESHQLVVEGKAAYDPEKKDCVTNADPLAQKMYIEEITRDFPTFGVIAEEKELTIPCTEPDADIYFTVDPLDGTKAYARKQSTGVGTMLALVKDREVIAAYIGDANTGEIFGFNPETPEGQVIRYRFGKEAFLEPNIKRALSTQYLLLREAPWNQPEMIQKMMRDPQNGGIFKNIEVGGGSIGIFAARIWTGEAGGMVLEPGYTTPWDQTPVVGILKRLGFVFYRIYENDLGTMVKAEPALIKEITRFPYTEVIVHQAHEETLTDWIKAYEA